MPKADLVTLLEAATNNVQFLTLELADANKKANDFQISLTTLQEELQCLKELKDVRDEKINILNKQLIKANRLIDQQQVKINYLEQIPFLKDLENNQMYFWLWYNCIF